MLTITIPDKKYFNENTNEFFVLKGRTITMQHSLYSIRKWESKWHTYYLDNKNLTTEQIIDYFRMMTITRDVDPRIYMNLSAENIQEISKYIHDPMTATTFKDLKSRQRSRGRREITTSEIVYYWMIINDIPFECEKWHLNQLMTLIRVCSDAKVPEQKMTEKEIFEYNKSLNERNRAKFHSKG